MTKKRIDYSGKKVNVGIDVHKKTYSIYCECEGQVVKRATVPAVPGKLVTLLKEHFVGAEIRSVYEAGFAGFGLHRTLLSNGIGNMVVNPASIEVAAKDKVKTDKRDCKKQAIQLAANRLEGIYVPSIEQEQQRLLSRTREQLVSERTRFGHRFKSRLYQFGLIGHDDETELSEAFIDDYLKQELSFQIKECLESLARVWKFIHSEIKLVDQKLKRQASGDKHERIYRNVPGIGPVCSRILSNELGDMSQYRNERALFSHTGLTPCEFSSGDTVRKGHITKQGSARLRWVLTEAAWRAIEKDPKLAADFSRIALKRGKKRAIVAIARKLVGRIRACFRKGVPYELGYGMAA